MKSTRCRNKYSSNEKPKSRPKIKPPTDSNPNFRNSFFRDLFKRKFKNKSFVNEKTFKNKNMLIESNLNQVISQYQLNNNYKNSPPYINRNNNTYLDSNKFYTISSASKIKKYHIYTKSMNNYNNNINNDNDQKKYIHVTKSFIDNLSNVKPKIDTNYKKINNSRNDGINNINDKKNHTHKSRPVRLKYKEYPNYTMNLYCVLKQVNDFNNGIYGNQLDNKSVISSLRRITNENEDTSIIDEIKDIQDPINNDFNKNVNSRNNNNNNYYKKYSNSMSDLSDKNVNTKENKKRKSNIKSHNNKNDYRNDKEYLYKNNNINDNFNEDFDERNNNLISPIFTPDYSKKNCYYINNLAQNHFSIELNSEFKINDELSKLKTILLDSFTIYKEYNNDRSDNNRNKFNDNDFRFTKLNFSVFSDKNKLTQFLHEKTHNFKIIATKKNNKNYCNKDIDPNNKLNFKDDDELVSYIKNKFQKMKDTEYNNEATKYNNFALSRKLNGKNIYEIGLENDLEKVNNILSKEKVEINNEPVIFVTKKEYNKLKNNKVNNISNIINDNDEEIENYKKIISALNFDNERTEEKYKSLEEEYNKLLNLKTPNSEKQINKLSEENENLKKDKEKLTKYIYDLQEYDKKLIEYYENRIKELIQQLQNQSINNVYTFNQKNNPFAVVNSKIDTSKKNYIRESSNMNNNNCDPPDQFSFKENGTINNNNNYNSNENDVNKATVRIKKTQDLYSPESEKSKSGKSDRITGMAKLLEMKLKPGLMNSNIKNDNKIEISNDNVENLVNTKPIVKKNKKQKISFDSDE